MSLAARITTTATSRAPNEESHETASSKSNLPILNRRMWSGRRDRRSRPGLLRERRDIAISGGV